MGNWILAPFLVNISLCRAVGGTLQPSLLNHLIHSVTRLLSAIQSYDRLSYITYSFLTFEAICARMHLENIFRNSGTHGRYRSPLIRTRGDYHVGSFYGPAGCREQIAARICCCSSEVISTP